MASNLGIDNALIEKARRIGKHKTKKETVIAALEEYVRTREQSQILELMGKVDYYPDYDYKREQWRKRIERLKPRQR